MDVYGVSLLEFYRILRRTVDDVQREKGDDGKLDPQEIAGIVKEFVEEIAMATDPDVMHDVQAIADLIDVVLPYIPGDYDPE